MKLILPVLLLVISLNFILPKSDYDRADAAFKEARVELRIATEKIHREKLKF